jgi:hypothetical protein
VGLALAIPGPGACDAGGGAVRPQWRRVDSRPVLDERSCASRDDLANAAPLRCAR